MVLFELGLRLVKDYYKVVYCHLACLTSAQCISYEMQGWMNHKLESKMAREISITSDT